MRIKPGACVIVSLHDPKEKFWGILEKIDAAGIFLRGVDLNSYEELLRMIVRGEEGIYPASAFFPLLRVERILLDETTGSIQSLKERFEQRSGMQLTDFLGLSEFDSEFDLDGDDPF